MWIRMNSGVISVWLVGWLGIQLHSSQEHCDLAAINKEYMQDGMNKRDSVVEMVRNGSLDLSTVSRPTQVVDSD